LVARRSTRRVSAARERRYLIPAAVTRAVGGRTAAVRTAVGAATITTD